DGFQFPRQRSIEGPQPLRLLEGDSSKDLLLVLPLDRRPQRQQFIQRRAQRVDIGAMIDEAVLC
ncbi:MAG TPA: hypothetical protein VKE98_03160, partial [Gemmataceae bacterium]|nr:hypothetical protein [Gemmataceae bacterium]